MLVSLGEGFKAKEDMLFDGGAVMIEGTGLAVATVKVTPADGSRLSHNVAIGE